MDELSEFDVYEVSISGELDRHFFGSGSISSAPVVSCNNFALLYAQ